MNKSKVSFVLFVTTLMLVIAVTQIADAAESGQAHFSVDVSIATAHPARVRVHWRTTCTAGTAQAGRQGHFISRTPIEMALPVPFAQADSCHATVWARNLDHPRGIPSVNVTVSQT